MSRRDGVLALFVALVVGAGGWWWWSTSRAPAQEPELAPVVAQAESVATTLRVDARRRIGVEAVPCRASGRVVRASDGTGVADAVVVLHQPRVLAPPAPVLKRTDASGHWSADELTPGRWNVTASASALAPAILRGLTFEAGKDHGDLQLVLDDVGSELVGRISDPTGAPIADVRVELMRAVERSTGTSAIVATTTDGNGRYRMGVRHDGYVARVVHPDYVSMSRHIVVSSDGRRTRDFLLAPGGVIRGRVRARDDGRAIAGAIVRQQLGSGGSLGAMQNDDYDHHVAAAADGTFELRGLPAGNIGLVASGPGATSVEATMIPLGVAETVDDVELLVDPGYTIAGFVVADDDDTVGIAGVTVGVMDFADVSRGRSSEPSSSDGFFEIHGVMPGHYTLLLFGDEIVPNMRESVEVGSTNRDDMLVRALRGQRIRGRIEPAGRAVVRLAVAMPTTDRDPGIAQLMNRMMCTFRSAATAADGTFEIGPVVPGPYRVEVDGDALRGTLDIDVGERDHAEFVVPMKPGLKLEGTLRDADGVVVPGVTVALTRTDAPRVLSLAQTVDNAADSAVADDDGRIEIGGIEAGTYTYIVRDDAGMRLPLVGKGGVASLEPGTIAIARDAELTIVVPAARTLRGRVVDDSGAPVAGAWVTTWPNVDITEVQIGATIGGPVVKKPTTPVLESLQRQASRLFALPPVLSGKDGSFTLTGLRRERYSLSAHADRGRLQGDLTDRPSDDVVTLVVRPLADLRIVLAADDEPGGEIRVRLDGIDTRALTFRAAPELSITRLLPGRWHVTVDAPGGIATGELELVGGSTGVLNVDLAPWASVRGRVVDARTGAPQAGLYAMVAAPTETLGDLMSRAGQMLGAMSGGSEARIDADGAFAIDHLPPGKLRVGFVATPAFEHIAVLELDGLQPGEVRDVGTVEGLALESVPPDEQGWTGLDTSIEGDEQTSSARKILVDDVERGSPADRGGIRKGDRIVAIDGFETSRFGARVVRNALAEGHLHRGAELRLRIDRNGATSEVELVVAAAKAQAP